VVSSSSCPWSTKAADLFPTSLSVWREECQLRAATRRAVSGYGVASRADVCSDRVEKCLLSVTLSCAWRHFTHLITYLQTSLFPGEAVAEAHWAIGCGLNPPSPFLIPRHWFHRFYDEWGRIYVRSQIKVIDWSLQHVFLLWMILHIIASSHSTSQEHNSCSRHIT
jgi:hypothetical protein